MELTLVEKHRPFKFDQIIGNEWIIKILKRLIEQNALQHIMFFGPPGTGKTTMAYVLASEYFGKKISLKTDHKEYAEINASDDRGIDTVRGWIKQFGQTKSHSRNSDGELLKRVMVIDEFDNTTRDFQMAFRAVAEKNQENCLYICIGNHQEGIKERALFSRCMVFNFDPQSSDKLGIYFKNVAEKEDIVFKNEELIQDIINHPEYKGDFRRVINDTLQKLVDREDLPWIYRDSYRSLIDTMIATKKFIDPFFSFYKDKSVNCVIFLRQLAKMCPSITLPLAKVLAEVEYRLKMGGDELIQMTYALTACEVLG
jgi:DNA polymerase III delta prime subunit